MGHPGQSDVLYHQRVGFDTHNEERAEDFAVDKALEEDLA